MLNKKYITNNIFTFNHNSLLLFLPSIKYLIIYFYTKNSISYLERTKKRIKAMIKTATPTDNNLYNSIFLLFF